MVNDEGSKFKIGGIVRILEHKKHFHKRQCPKLVWGFCDCKN